MVPNHTPSIGTTYLVVLSGFIDEFRTVETTMVVDSIGSIGFPAFVRQGF
jgi:hypothetical protein